MVKDEILILDPNQVNQKIRRIAFEIYESNFMENEIILAGINGLGYELAIRIKSELELISDLGIEIIEVGIDKKSPHFDDIKLSVGKEEIIGKNVVIENSVIGPHISIGDNSKIFNSVLKNSIIQNNSNLHNLNIQNSMVGNYVDIKGEISEVSIGDYTNIIN